MSDKYEIPLEMQHFARKSLPRQDYVGMVYRDVLRVSDLRENGKHQLQNLLQVEVNINNRFMSLLNINKMVHRMK